MPALVDFSKHEMLERLMPIIERQAKEIVDLRKRLADALRTIRRLEERDEYDDRPPPLTIF